MSAFAVALIWASRPGHLFRGYALPLGAAVAAGTGLLLLAGWMPAYAGEYLGYMLGHHVHREVPLLVRGLDVGRVLSDLQGFSWLLRSLAVMTAISFVVEPVRARWNRFGVRHAVWVVLAAAILEIAMDGFRLLQLLRGIVAPTPQHRYLIEVLSDALPWVSAAGLLLLVLWFFAQGEPARLGKRVLLAGVAVYCATLAAGAAGDWSFKHFGFAVPLLLALAVRQIIREGSARVILLATCAVGLAVLLRPPLRHYPSDFATAASWMEEHQGLSEAIDTVLDACGPKRFMFLTDRVTAVPRHSPLGPLFQQELTMDRVSRRLSERTTGNFHRADLVVHDGRPPRSLEGLERLRILRSEFSRTPWHCAGGTLGFGSWEFHYRHPPETAGD